MILTVFRDRSADASQGDDRSEKPSISSDGSYVAFYSYADNLFDGDNNNGPDIFVRDIVSNTTTLVSKNGYGIYGNGGSYNPSISSDGRFVAFYSDASNLVDSDTNGYSVVFTFDFFPEEDGDDSDGDSDDDASELNCFINTLKIN